MSVNKPISSAIILIITAIVILLFAVPKYRESIVLQSYIVKKQSEYDYQLSQYLNTSKIVNAIESRLDVLEKINSALPSDYSVAPIVNFIQTQALKEKMIVQSIEFLPDSAVELKFPNQIKEMNFNLSLSGTYQGFKNFLSTMEQSDRLFQTNSIIGTLQPNLGYELEQSQFIPMDFKLQAAVHFY